MKEIVSFSLFFLFATFFLTSCVDDDPICEPDEYIIEGLGRVFPEKEKYTVDDTIYIEIAIPSNLNQFGIDDDILNKTKLTKGDLYGRPFGQNKDYSMRFYNYSANTHLTDTAGSNNAYYDSDRDSYVHLTQMIILESARDSLVPDFFVLNSSSVDFYNGDICNKIEIYTTIYFNDQVGDTLWFKLDY